MREKLLRNLPVSSTTLALHQHLGTSLQSYLTMAEALNFSGVDLKLFFDANTAATISIFTFLVIPPFLLCLLCVLALVLAKDMNAKIRLLLINIFTAETLSSFSFFFIYLGWPARFINEEGTSCKMLLSLNNLAGLLKFSGTSLYAVGVYVFIKHGDKKLKWYVIIPYIIVAWTVVILTVGLPPYLEGYRTQNVRGFCTANVFSAPYIGMAVSLTVGATIFLSIELTFCILTVLYMKRNVLGGNTSVKKAVAKVLGYMAVVSVLSFINSVLPHFIAMIFKSTLTGSNLTRYFTLHYMIRIFANITAFPNPIVTIILLKSVRDAIKTMSKKVSPCCHKNQEFSATIEEQLTTTAAAAAAATTTTTTTSTEEHPTTDITGVHLATTNLKEDSNSIRNHIATTDRNLSTTNQNPVTTEQDPTTTDKDLTATDENLATTDQHPATIDHNPLTLATTGIDLDAIQVATTCTRNKATIAKKHHLQAP